MVVRLRLNEKRVGEMYESGLRFTERSLNLKYMEPMLRYCLGLW